jgi:hypothetical protein
LRAADYRGATPARQPDSSRFWPALRGRRDASMSRLHPCRLRRRQTGERPAPCGNPRVSESHVQGGKDAKRCAQVRISTARLVFSIAWRPCGLRRPPRSLGVAPSGIPGFLCASDAKQGRQGARSCSHVRSLGNLASLIECHRVGGTKPLGRHTFFARAASLARLPNEEVFNALATLPPSKAAKQGDGGALRNSGLFGRVSRKARWSTLPAAPLTRNLLRRFRPLHEGEVG